LNKKSICIAATVLLLIVSISLTNVILADWDPDDGHKMHFPQTPDPFGWDVYCTAGLQGQPQVCLADDWKCPESGWITDIHFWGSWWNDVVGVIDHFVIGIAENIPADDQIPWSRPGETLVEWEIYDWVERGPYEGEQGFYWPFWSEYAYPDHSMYWQYNVFLDQKDWFWQEQGKIYWLFISAVVRQEEQPQPLWGWKSTDVEHNFMDDAVWAYWGELNWMPLKYPDQETSMNLAFVVTGEAGEPCVEIDKKVWDPVRESWVDEINAKIGENVKFKITVHNCGNVDLTNIQVSDTLPVCLEYVENSAEPQPFMVGEHSIIWKFQGPLKPCNTITITFTAQVISLGENINRAVVTAESSVGSVTDSDTATVNASGEASIEVDKKISKDGGITWSDELTAQVCTIVRFRITVHNDGEIDLTNIKVVDILPDCLEYKDNATPSEPMISGNKLTWLFPGPLKPCNTITIEFNAHVIREGENENMVTVTADYPTGTVSDTDTAVVHAIIDTTPPVVVILKPEKALYLFNIKIIPFPIPLIIGSIDIEAQATDTESGVNHVEFYIDNILKANDTTPPYVWTWSTPAYLFHKIKVVAVDNAGNSAYAEIKVIRLL